jgi:hypothetical protein
MAHLPPVTWNDVATNHDLRTVETVLRNEMRALESSLRGEMHTGFAELCGEIAVLRGEMHAGFADVRTEIATAVTNQTKWLMTVVIAWSALLVTAVQLLP